VVPHTSRQYSVWSWFLLHARQQSDASPMAHVDAQYAVVSASAAHAFQHALDAGLQLACDEQSTSHVHAESQPAVRLHPHVAEQSESHEQPSWQPPPVSQAQNAGATASQPPAATAASATAAHTENTMARPDMTGCYRGWLKFSRDAPDITVA
jgi:hypothetical protein